MTIRTTSVAFLTVLLFSMGYGSARGQARVSSGMDLSLQGGIQLPMGDSGLVQSGAYGATLTASLPVTSILDITAGIGYQNFGSHDVAIDSAGQHGKVSKQYTNYPFFAGARLIFDTPVLLPYIGGEFSLNDLVYHATQTGISALSIPAVTSIKLGYALLVGARVPIGPVFSADATVKYHVIPGESGGPTTTFISLNAGIAVHLNL